MTISKKLEKRVPSKRIAELEKLVEKQAEQIEQLRQRKKFSLPAGRKKTTGKSFVRVIIPDTHGAHIDKEAAGAFLRDLEMLKPAEVIRLGDHLDCGGFLAQHHTLGFVPETEYSFEDDVDAANAFLDETQRRAGGAEDWYIIGNHEARIEKWIIKQTLSHRKDAAFLFRLFGPENVLALEKRGIKVVKRDQCYHGLRKRGTIKLEKCAFMHGTRTGVYAAKHSLDDISYNVVFGHTHRISSFVKETLHGTIGAWSVGCLCSLNPLYGDTKVSNWAHGYGIQVVSREGGQFMHITVPILRGESYLRYLYSM